jgi:hypothetical protein
MDSVKVSNSEPGIRSVVNCGSQGRFQWTRSSSALPAALRMLHNASERKVCGGQLTTNSQLTQKLYLRVNCYFEP